MIKGIKPCFSKDTVKKTKNVRPKAGWILHSTDPTKGLYPVWIKNSYNSILRRQATQWKIVKDLQIMNKDIKRCWTSLVIREIKLNPE